MLLARAFVLGLSPRALLAVAALALSVAYALVSAGALSGLEVEAATLDEARDRPGYVLYDSIDTDDGADLARFPASETPNGILIVDWRPHEGVRVATHSAVHNPQDYPGLPNVDRPLIGDHAPANAHTLANTIAEEHELEDPRQVKLEYFPRDSLVVPYRVYTALFPDETEQARLAYGPGEPPATDLQSTHWQGIGAFYESGTRQLHGGLIGIIIATGAIAALLASGLVYLEVLARRRDLATIQSFGGSRLTRNLVIARTLTLVTAGLLLGLVVALVALRLAESAMNTSLNPPPLAWAATILAVGTGATLAGSIAGLRALTRHGLRHTGTTSLPIRRFPGPVRFFTVTPRIFPGIFAATLVTASILIAITGALAMPSALFDAPEEDGMTYVGAGTGNVLRGSVDRMLGTHGHHFPGVLSSNPETFAPTTLGDRPVMVRGVDHALWREQTDGRIVDGRWPTATGEAMIGIRAHRTTGIAPGDTLLLPASYHHGVEPLVITGIHRSGGLEDDQILSDLDTAGRLAGLPPDRVTGIRMILDPDDPDATVPTPTGVHVTRLVVTPNDPVPHTTASAELTLLNFDHEDVRHPVTLRVNDEAVETRTPRVPARSEITERIDFKVPDAESIRVEVNPSQELSTRTLTLTIDAPEVARPGEETPITVHDDQGEPVANAQILLDAQEIATTDANGQAVLPFDEPRLAELVALHEEDAGIARIRVAPPEWDDVPHLVAERIAFDPVRHNETLTRVTARATIVNLGGADFDDPTEWILDETSHLEPFTLESAARGTNPVTRNWEAGTHTFTVAGLTETFTVRPPTDPGDDGSDPSDGSDNDDGGAPAPSRPRTVEEAVALKVQQGGTGIRRPDNPLDSFIAGVIRNLDGATFLIILATVIHGGSLVWVSTLRDVRERERVPILLRTLGADEDQLRARTLRDVLLAAIPPILLGLLVAPLVLLAFAQWGYPAAFGHTLPAVVDLAFIARTGAALLLIAGLAALYGVATNRPPRNAVAPRRALPEWFVEARTQSPRKPESHAKPPPGPPGGPR